MLRNEDKGWVLVGGFSNMEVFGFLDKSYFKGIVGEIIIGVCLREGEKNWR